MPEQGVESPALPLAEELADLPAEKRERVLQLAATYYAGPLPPPAMLEAYERASEGAARLILEQFMEESAHRRALETEELRQATAESRRAQWLAFTLGITGLAGAIYLGAAGQTVACSVLAGGVLASLVTAFLRGSIADPEPSPPIKPPPAAKPKDGKRRKA